MIELTPEIVEQYRCFRQPVGVTPLQVAQAARTLRGLDYSLHPTRVVEKEDGSLEGSVDCFRFLVMVAQKLGFLPADWDVATMRRPQPKLAPSRLILAVLQANTDTVPREPEAVQLGDILVLANVDIHPDLKEPHHGAIVTWRYPAPFIGKMTHAEDYRQKGLGKVYEQEIDALAWRRVHSVFRFRGLEGGADLG